MSERRAKQARRLQRLLETGSPERTTPRLPKRSPEPSLIGWVPTRTDYKGRQIHHTREKARRLRQRFTVLAGVPYYGDESASD